MPPYHARTLRGLALALALTIPAAAGAQTAHVFPSAGCAEIQECIDAAAPGDVVRIATAEPIGRALQLRRSITVEAAPGVAATLADGASVFVNTTGTASADVTVRGLTLERGAIDVTHASTGPLRLQIVDNEIRASRTPFTAAIDVGGLITVPAAGDVTFDIRDNRVRAEIPPLGEPIGIRVALGPETAASGTMAGNRVTLEPGFTGRHVVLTNGARTLDVAVLGNVVAGGEENVGIEVEQTRAGGLLTLLFVNNLVTGTFDEIDGVRLAAQAGRLRFAVVNNTLASLIDGLRVDVGAEGVADGVVANNLVARTNVALRFDAAALAQTTFGPNLLFDFFESHLAVGTIIADPALDEDFRPAAGSPAEDAGGSDLVPAIVTTDLAGGPRVRGEAVDLGAFERDAAPGPEPELRRIRRSPRAERSTATTATRARRTAAMPGSARTSRWRASRAWPAPASDPSPRSARRCPPVCSARSTMPAARSPRPRPRPGRRSSSA